MEASHDSLLNFENKITAAVTAYHVLSHNKIESMRIQEQKRTQKKMNETKTSKTSIVYWPAMHMEPASVFVLAKTLIRLPQKSVFCVIQEEHL